MLPQCHVSSALLYCLTLHCSRNTRVNRLNNHVLTATHGHSDILIHATYNSPLPGLEWSQNAPQRRSGSFLRKRALKTFILRMIHVKIISCHLKSMFSYQLQNTTGQTRHNLSDGLLPDLLLYLFKRRYRAMLALSLSALRLRVHCAPLN